MKVIIGQTCVHSDRTKAKLLEEHVSPAIALIVKCYCHNCDYHKCDYWTYGQSHIQTDAGQSEPYNLLC